MTPADVDAFTETFNRLRAVFPLRADKAELNHIVRLYFRALERFAIEDVDAGADAWTNQGTRFPKPAEWIAAVPRNGVRRYPELSDDEAAEHRAAIAAQYVGDPCTCYDCRQAGVTHRLLRHVPLEGADGKDLLGILDGRVVTRGHWLHGEELARWYEARDAYLELQHRIGGPKLLTGDVPRGTTSNPTVTARTHDDEPDQENP
jgi:hypothetical protein